jgi:hypothetical protein
MGATSLGPYCLVAATGLRVHPQGQFFSHLHPGDANVTQSSALLMLLFAVCVGPFPAPFPLHSSPLPPRSCHRPVISCLLLHFIIFCQKEMLSEEGGKEKEVWE